MKKYVKLRSKEKDKEITHEELKKRVNEFVKNNREKVIEF